MSATAPAQVITELLGGSPLSRAIQERRLPAELQSWSPTPAPDWGEHVARARDRVPAGWYGALEQALSPGAAASARLQRVVAERGVIVTTGQQAALFGGPVYTIAKAFTALAVADAIEQRFGVATAPVFWAATDDADFLEASVARVADADGLLELKLQSAPPAGTTMSSTPLSRKQIATLIRQLRRTCGSAPHPAYLEMAVSAFSRASTVGNAYVEFMRALLEPLGIAVLDASSDACRNAGRLVTQEALARAPAIARELAEQGRVIRAAGFEPQVQDERGLSLVFEVSGGVKRRMTIEEAAAARGRHGALAPNVLLRPIVEREILPTVTYVGGPGEIAYFVQSNAVARCLGRDVLHIVPRWSCTIVEPFVHRALARLGIAWRDVRNVHAVERRIATQALPPDIASEWKELRERVHRMVREFQATVERHDLLPASVMEGLDRSLQHRLSRGERRLLAAVKRREERRLRDLRTASASLFPMGSRQERILNYVPMLARGGDALMADMQRAARAHAASLLSPAPAAALAVP